MTYATVADLLTRFSHRELIQLTDRSDPPADAVNDGVAQSALDAAASIVDGYVGAKYALPLQTVPQLLTEATCDIARFRLYADQAPEIVRQRYVDAIKLLEGVSQGRVKIDAAGVEPPSRSDVIETSGPRRMFDRCSMARF